jgi:hypothetical protein
MTDPSTTKHDTPSPRRAPSLWALGLGLVLTILVGLVRPAPRTQQRSTGTPAARFWAAKVAVEGSLDIALAGDSRVFRGLSPEEMRAALPDARIGNLGFSAACLCGDYLGYVERSLAKDARAPLVVVGVTPHSLTGHAARDNGFLAERRRPARERLEELYLRPLVDFVRPLSLAEIGLPVGDPGRRGSLYLQEFHPDGWVASRLEPESPNGALIEYERVLRGSKVEAALVDELAASVARLRARGVRVVAFRPPTTPEMRALEDRLAAHDEPALSARLRAAGAEYWELGGAYHTYDGSHLDESSARALSRDVAARIAATR